MKSKHVINRNHCLVITLLFSFKKKLKEYEQEFEKEKTGIGWDYLSSFLLSIRRIPLRQPHFPLSAYEKQKMNLKQQFPCQYNTVIHQLQDQGTFLNKAVYNYAPQRHTP